MESNNYNGVHIISEAVIMGGISMYFYKKISELESTIEDLKGQIAMQNDQIRFLLGSNTTLQQPKFTPLKIPQQPQRSQLPQQTLQPQRSQPPQQTLLQQPQRPQTLPQTNRKENFNFAQVQEMVNNSTKQQCENGVCQLVPKNKEEKKVVISKISKQIEFDTEGINQDETCKVKTFTDFSPNPVIKSVTPKPSVSLGENDLQKILNDIDDE
ncbi:hypothetical protein IIV22_008L [Invertebrate iridescent virus 22]|uniref:Uncharacterized protein n=1 Tax=Invertebrate iridescent virus 22 TaxID=345198 RepID=S6DF19_9VIRU|nr:hypothetical protein IIV22_008L [Invertebrate iridescent virus 22]CCV01685.1 hypothetical protein IIV22_008L [Invertebrate iridescent virus 22]